MEDMLGRFQVNHPEGLKCGNNKKIHRMCVSRECQESSLMCNYTDCDKCKGRAHRLCSTIEFEGVTEQLQVRSSQQKKFFEKQCEVEDDFRGKLMSIRETLIKKYIFGEKNSEIIKKIYQKGDITCLKGKESQ